MEIQQGQWKIEHVVVPMNEAWQLADGTWLTRGETVFRVWRDQGHGWHALTVSRTAREAGEYVDTIIAGETQPFDLARLLDDADDAYHQALADNPPCSTCGGRGCGYCAGTGVR